jgi:restriction endonuclease S subunit
VNAPSLNPDWAKLPIFDRSRWQRLRFGEFAKSINERVDPSEAAEDVYVGLEHLDPESLHIRRWGKGSDVIGTKLRFQKGDNIFGRRRAYQRKLAVAEFDGICSAHAMVVRATPGIILPEFLPFLMMSDRFMNRAVEISVGSLSPTINWKTLKQEEFALPPLDQQRRIAEILWAVDQSFENYRAVQQGIESTRKADLANRIQLVGEGAKQLRVGQLAPDGEDALRTGPFGSKLNAECFASNGIPIINIAAIGDAGVEEDGLLFLKPSLAAEFRSYFVRSGDLVFSRVAEIGRCMMIDQRQVGSMISSNLIRIRVNPDRIRPSYLLLLLRYCSATQNQIRRLTSTGGRMLVNTRTLSELIFSVPDLARQDEIVERANLFELTIRRCDEAVAGTASLAKELRENCL